MSSVSANQCGESLLGAIPVRPRPLKLLFSFARHPEDAVPLIGADEFLHPPMPHEPVEIAPHGARLDAQAVRELDLRQIRKSTDRGEQGELANLHVARPE